MPIIKSAIKRVRQSETKRKRNLIAKRKYKALIKDFTDLIKDGKKAEAAKMMPTLQKAIDMASKKNILHKNTAGRRKSQLMKMLADDAKKAPAKAAPAKKEAKKEETGE